MAMAEVPNLIPALPEIFLALAAIAIAAVLVEPVLANIGVIPAQKAFLKQLRMLTKKAGALLIFDEVLTGFRLALGGAQEYFGVVPDLCTFGKAVSNGYPLAVFAGSAEVMEQGFNGDNKAFITTTYAGETLSLAAAKATITLMKNEPVHKRIHEQGQKLMDGMTAIFGKYGVPGAISGHPASFSAVIRTEDDALDKMFTRQLVLGLVQRGLLTKGGFNTSYSHGDNEIDDTLSAFDRAVESLEL